MIVDITAFEQDIAARYNAGDIRAPIHLDGSVDGVQERHLTDHFKNHFKPGDWICCTWRSHAKCLLAGVPPSILLQEILEGRSIAICLPRYRIISSAIVGGILPIALGLAMALKRSGSDNHVHCFVGDMTHHTGAFHETFTYACNHDLPLHLIVEDNGRSVNTPTRPTWGLPLPQPELDGHWTFPIGDDGVLTYFRYEPIYPHSGAGTWVNW